MKAESVLSIYINKRTKMYLFDLYDMQVSVHPVVVQEPGKSIALPQAVISLLKMVKPGTKLENIVSN